MTHFISYIANYYYQNKHYFMNDQFIHIPILNEF